MSNQLQGRRIAFLVANDGVEQIELTRPWDTLKDAGATVVLVAPEVGKVQGRHHLDAGDTFEADLAVAEADASTFDALVLPGGVANPDDLRTRPDAVRLVRAFAEAGKPVAAICHAPWTLIDAGLVEGRADHELAEPQDRSRPTPAPSGSTRRSSSPATVVTADHEPQAGRSRRLLPRGRRRCRRLTCSPSARLASARIDANVTIRSGADRARR